uniref:Uncharacterized protein n=1 Tax=Oryza nivara TaxID=4536 RepID=A0A0E0IK75_ORYNI
MQGEAACGGLVLARWPCRWHYEVCWRTKAQRRVTAKRTASRLATSVVAGTSNTMGNAISGIRSTASMKVGVLVHPRERHRRVAAVREAPPQRRGGRDVRGPGEHRCERDIVGGSEERGGGGESACENWVGRLMEATGRTEEDERVDREGEHEEERVVAEREGHAAGDPSLWRALDLLHNLLAHLMSWDALAEALARLHDDVHRRTCTTFVPSARPPCHCTSPCHPHGHREPQPDAPRTASPRATVAATTPRHAARTAFTPMPVVRTLPLLSE